MTYIVTYSRAHDTAREIGQFAELTEAFAAAESAGAVINDRSDVRKDRCFDVRGHEGDDDYGVWIERSR